MRKTGLRIALWLLTLLLSVLVWTEIVHYLYILLSLVLFFPIFIWQAISDRLSGVSRLPRLSHSELVEALFEEFEEKEKRS